MLVVCEGYAEEYFLKHLRSLFMNRQGHMTLQVKNARGKGGRHVLDVALKPHVRRGFDTVAILVDTDTNWNEIQKRDARDGKILIIDSTPCFEALLLAIVGKSPPGSTAACKAAFKMLFGFEAHDPRLYGSNFSREVLQRARTRVSELRRLLELINS